MGQKIELKTTSFNKNIIFNNVSFKYNIDDEYILENINLTIEKGSIIAITGESGSGKTTLAKAIAKKIFHHGEINITRTNTENLNIVFVEQQHEFKNKQNINQFYHQQRFNSFDTELPDFSR